MSCPACGDRGERTYGSTATWHGGTAGQALTRDVCDRCWGSGDVANPGENLRRKLEQERAAYQARYRNDAAFRWKQRARKFAWRARNHRSNYRELSKEIQRLHGIINGRDELLNLQYHIWNAQVEECDHALRYKQNRGGQQAGIPTLAAAPISTLLHMKRTAEAAIERLMGLPR